MIRGTSVCAEQVSVLERNKLRSKALNEITTLITTQQVDESSWILETKGAEM
jgi:hypothetical protein